MKKINQTSEKSCNFLSPYELKPHLLNFTKQLSDKGYSSLSIKGYIDSISHLGTWLDKQGILLKEVNSETISNFAEHRCCCPGGRRKPSISKKYVNRVQRFIIYLYQQGVILNDVSISNNSVSVSIIQFSEFLHLRGLSSKTIRRYTDCINIILPLLGSKPKDYNAKIIKQVIFQLSKQYAPGGLKSLTTALRSYLRFLAVEEQCIPDLDRAVPTVANWSLSSMPKYIVAEEIEQVINSCDIHSLKGLRDRAIILLLSRIGLRAGDIVGMKLDHINWHDGTLHLFGKGHREDCLPLPQDAGDAILDYIEKGRPPVKIAEVFLCLNAPYRSLSSSAVVSSLVASAITRSGIATPASCGAHLLRHSAATQMLRSGATLETVSSILRHRSVNMTGYYAKVDMPMLATIVQLWPEVKSC